MWFAILYISAMLFACWIGAWYVTKKGEEIDKENEPLNDHTAKLEKLNELQFELHVLQLLGHNLEAKFLWSRINRLTKELSGV